MENSNPRHRVENLKNIRQVCTNAYLLEATCGLSITWGALLYATRRRAPQTLYCVLFPLHITADQSQAARKSFDAFTDRVFDLALTNPKGEPLPVLYADADHRAVFAKGVPPQAKQVEGMHLWESVSSSTRMLEPASASTFHDGLAADALARAQLRRLNVKKAYEGLVLVYATSTGKTPPEADAPGALPPGALRTPAPQDSDDDDDDNDPPPRRRGRSSGAAASPAGQWQAVVGALYEAGAAGAAAAVNAEEPSPAPQQETAEERRDMHDIL
jgi:hypothetical protein